MGNLEDILEIRLRCMCKHALTHSKRQQMVMLIQVDISLLFHAYPQAFLLFLSRDGKKDQAQQANQTSMSSPSIPTISSTRSSHPSHQLVYANQLDQLVQVVHPDHLGHPSQIAQRGHPSHPIKPSILTIPTIHSESAIIFVLVHGSPTQEIKLKHRKIVEKGD